MAKRALSMTEVSEFADEWHAMIYIYKYVYMSFDSAVFNVKGHAYFKRNP